MGHRSRRQPARVDHLPPVELTIESMTLEGKGVAHLEGKVIFVEGALPTETVKARYTLQKKSFDEAVTVEVLTPSDERVTPKCMHYSVCGGCSWQHLAPEAQIRYKQQALLDQLKHVGKVEPDTVLEPLRGDIWGYRRKARLGVRYVPKKGKVLVGFREREGSFLADLTRCEVLHPSVGEHLVDLQQLMSSMSQKERIPQIEVAVGDNATALIVRHLEPLTAQDIELLRAYGERMNQQIYLQPKGPDTVHCIWPTTPTLYYEHPQFNTRVEFGPQDFFQINQSINRLMVKRAVELLDPQANETVLDLFCGLGNFTLPLAQQAMQVTGVEGDAVMVKRAKHSAELNDIHNTDYHACNLMDDDALKQQAWLKRHYDKILLDPPRAGAIEIMPYIGRLKAKRIVYVSCNPATLARDAHELVNTHGYRLTSAGVMDMFPHTSHVESIAVFDK
ncbi:23S rRNA (uracil(1939)-C(5))-methyltransferase RlmD [Thiofilum flexile]|uniref:23S rRNA (uracil(1939)-C(5))-methyltransferase RlmD n=1 Tax=Thiofilum flexile TaxID=125627 RepID=UPI000367E43A|nr:23S rRNA (uracil(1939)-C(5))-methyltransferase RlmD [Thiofilum flexile]